MLLAKYSSSDHLSRVFYDTRIRQLDNPAKIMYTLCLAARKTGLEHGGIGILKMQSHAKAPSILSTVEQPPLVKACYSAHVTP